MDYSSPVSAYQQVIKAIKIEILFGNVKRGDRLPPIRHLAKTIKLNPNTVSKAYYNLEKEKLIECKGRKGSFVKYKEIKLDTIRKNIAEEEFRNIL